MIITFTNVIGAIRTAFSVVRSGLKMWLGFETSETLGREEVIDGDFPTETNWVLSSASISDNKCTMTSVGGASTYFYQTGLSLTQNKYYKISFKATRISGDTNLSFNSFTGTNVTDSPTISQSGEYSFDFTPTINVPNFGLKRVAQSGSGAVWEIENFSVKELTQITPDKSDNNNVGELFTGKAIELDGINDEINFGTAQIPVKTISFWIKPLSVSNEGLFYLGLSGFPQFRQISITSGNISATSYLTNFTPYVNNIQTSAVTQDVWQRVVLTFDEWTTTSLQIGKVYSSVYGHFAISDVQFYNETWSTDDIAYDYANPQNLVTDRSGTSIALSNLKGYWHLSEGDGSLVYDSSGEGNNGTINGATYEPAQPRIPQLGMMNWSKGSNLIEYSEDFTQWTNNNSTDSSNTNTSPLGSLTASTVTSNTNSTFSGIYKGENNLAAGEYTFSVYLKSSNITSLSLRLRADTTQLAVENITITNEWNRYSITATTTTTTGVFQSHVFLNSDGISGTSNVGDEVYIWGAQLEESSSAGAYRLTDGAVTSNSTVIPNPAIPTQDIFGNAVRDRLNSFNLDGSGYAEVADDTDLDFGTGAFTMECWVRIDGNTDRRLLDKRNTTSGYTLYLTGSNVLKLELNDGTGNSGFDLTSSLNSNTWLHLAVVCDRSANATCYINKAAQTPVSISSKNGNIDSTSNLIIGADAPDGLSLFSTDIISDVRLYKGKLLSATEVENNYNAGLSAHTND